MRPQKIFCPNVNDEDKTPQRGKRENFRLLFNKASFNRSAFLKKISRSTVCSILCNLKVGKYIPTYFRSNSSSPKQGAIPATHANRSNSQQIEKDNQKFT